MSSPPPDARITRARIRRREACGEDAVILTLHPDEPVPFVRAGSFFMLRRDDRFSPLIPRPLSIYRQGAGDLEFLVKVVGRGTRALALADIGQKMVLTGPLGNGWPTLDGSGLPWVLLAGGVGSASFFTAIEQALVGMDGAEPVPPDRLALLFGAAREGLLYDLERFRELGVPVHGATDDGSAGFHGNVLELLGDLVGSGALPERFRILACGPDPMLAAVEAYARERELDAWLSLETLMGCGVGICNACIVPTRSEGPMGDWPHAKCCVEGPVFGIDSITLDRSGKS
jgi:dihydroorotate dehydrogenase electron transfer subunit